MHDPNHSDNQANTDTSTKYQQMEQQQPPSPPAQEVDFSKITWDGVRHAIQQLAMEREHYHGYPLPDDEHPLVVHPRFPLQTLNGAKLGKEDDPLEGFDAATRSRIRELYERYAEGKVINHWFSRRRQEDVLVWRTSEGKSRVCKTQNSIGRRADLALSTIGVSRCWDRDAEWTAMEKLSELLPIHLWNYYILTGSFIERSPRSQLLYLFRRCRPTLVLSDKPIRGIPSIRPLCALCMHPIGYYEGTFGGGMVPTDDIIAHLLLMRGDEHHYWKCSNQHSVWIPEAGL